jgi:hypothetical protein
MYWHTCRQIRTTVGRGEEQPMLTMRFGVRFLDVQTCKRMLAHHRVFCFNGIMKKRVISKSSADTLEWQF